MLLLCLIFICHVLFFIVTRRAKKSSSSMPLKSTPRQRSNRGSGRNNIDCAACTARKMDQALRADSIAATNQRIIENKLKWNKNME